MDLFELKNDWFVPPKPIVCVFEKSSGLIWLRRKGISEWVRIVLSTSAGTLNLLPRYFCSKKGVSYCDPPKVD